MKSAPERIRTTNLLIRSRAVRAATDASSITFHITPVSKSFVKKPIYVRPATPFLRSLRKLTLAVIETEAGRKLIFTDRRLRLIERDFAFKAAH
jgi:hypothetical protein